MPRLVPNRKRQEIEYTNWSISEELRLYLEHQFNFNFYVTTKSRLTESWGTNNTILVLPPTGRELPKYMKKAFEESLHNDTVVCLVPARTDTRWWHDWVIDYASEIRYFQGRLTFINLALDKKVTAPFPSVLVIYRN